jgi:luciferase family oxidoreductase group 1
MVPLSVLDLSPIVEGRNAADALRNTLDLARHAERWGFRRYWLAEHHNMPGIASAATSIVIAHVANGTTTIRVGAGGIMLPNHSPLAIAEQFGTLESLYPGRIDLGLGRAPGSDGLTARAMRRNSTVDEAEAFPRDVLELIAYFQGDAGPVRAVPGAGLHVPIWILGSSTFGAQLAAALGLPYSFASHFAPGQMMQAIDVYRAQFRPSQWLEQPYVMLGFNVFLRRGRPGQLPPPSAGYGDQLEPAERAMIAQALSSSAVGSPETVRRGMKAFIDRTAADELIITSQIFDHAARLRSYEITAALRDALDD